MKLGLPLGSHRTQHASYIIREERLGNMLENHEYVNVQCIYSGHEDVCDKVSLVY